MDNKFLHLAAKSFNHSLNDEEEFQLTSFLKIKENQIDYDRLQKIWNESGEVGYKQITENLDVEKAFSKVRSRSGMAVNLKRSYISLHRYGIAAALLALIAAVGFFNLDFIKNDTYNSIVAIENSEHVLPDNSVVWLAKGSTIKFNKNFKEGRSVELIGKAQFDVTPDKSRPFTVDAQNLDVKVLGTSFIVSTSEANEYVHVLHGKVQVTDKSKQDDAFLLTKDMSVKLEDSRLQATDQLDINDMFWSSKYLVYKNTPLDKLLPELQNIFNTTIELNQSIGTCQFSGKFNDMSLDEIIESLRLIYNLDVTKNNNSIIINGTSCETK